MLRWEWKANAFTLSMQDMWSISTSKRTSKATQASVDDNLSKGLYD